MPRTDDHIAADAQVSGLVATWERHRYTEEQWAGASALARLARLGATPEALLPAAPATPVARAKDAERPAACGRRAELGGALGVMVTDDGSVVKAGAAGAATPPPPKESPGCAVAAATVVPVVTTASAAAAAPPPTPLGADVAHEPAPLSREEAIARMHAWHAERDASRPTASIRLAVVARAITNIQGRDGRWDIKDAPGDSDDDKHALDAPRVPPPPPPVKLPNKCYAHPVPAPLGKFGASAAGLAAAEEATQLMKGRGGGGGGGGGVTRAPRRAVFSIDIVVIGDHEKAEQDVEIGEGNPPSRGGCGGGGDDPACTRGDLAPIGGETGGRAAAAASRGVTPEFDLALHEDCTCMMFRFADDDDDDDATTTVLGACVASSCVAPSCVATSPAVAPRFLGTGGADTGAVDAELVCSKSAYLRYRASSARMSRTVHRYGGAPAVGR